MLFAKLRDRIFRVAKLPAQVDNAIVEPTRSTLGRLKTRVELVDHIGISYGVGELRRALRLVPSNGNAEERPSVTRNVQRSAQPTHFIADRGVFRDCFWNLRAHALRFFHSRWRIRESL